MTKKIFDNLLVLDLANNHFGDVSHAKNIIKKFGIIRKKYNLNSTIKFQFRQLPEFVHEDYRNSDIKYVRRFLDTRLSDKKFFEIFNLNILSRIKYKDKLIFIKLYK